MTDATKKLEEALKDWGNNLIELTREEERRNIDVDGHQFNSFLRMERKLGQLEERKRIIKHLNEKDRGRTHSAAMLCFYCQMIDWLEGQGK